ncbi:MAG: RNA 3'-terminal phosphate cyclase [Candidatus ainarchaeum sp.]|nr:RNA 3'-terminal phosphate cyclase [Candidatus ainarchaeum sp.]
MPELIEIDASQGEGGGQVLRTALALSALLEKPVHIFNVRAGRPAPGLKAQHLAAVNAIAALSKAEIKGNFPRSTDIFFSPKKIVPEKFNVNIGTAGAISLFLQQLLPLGLKNSLDFHVSGGTDVAFAPSICFLQNALFPKLKKAGARFEAKVLAQGFFPKGCGRVFFRSSPSKLPLKPLVFSKAENFSHFECFSSSSGLPQEVSARQARSAKKTLLEKFPDADWVERLSSKQEIKETTGSAIDLFAVFENTSLGANALGEKGRQSELVGEEAAKKLVEELSSGNAVDSHCADQLLVFMALAKGASEIRVPRLSQHCLTNISIIEKFLPCKFEIDGALNLPAAIRVEGVSFR